MPSPPDPRKASQHQSTTCARPPRTAPTLWGGSLRFAVVTRRSLQSIHSSVDPHATAIVTRSSLARWHGQQASGGKATGSPTNPHPQPLSHRSFRRWAPPRRPVGEGRHTYDVRKYVSTKSLAYSRTPYCRTTVLSPLSLDPFTPDTSTARGTGGQELVGFGVADDLFFLWPSHATLRPSLSESMPSRLIVVERWPISMSQIGRRFVLIASEEVGPQLGDVLARRACAAWGPRGPSAALRLTG